MRITETEIKEIIGLLERLGYSMGVETVFRDWCECFALALSTARMTTDIARVRVTETLTND